MRNSLFFSAILAILPAVASAGLITVDGSATDWGLARNGSASDWTPSPQLGLLPGVHYTVEDQTGGANTRLTPGYGGQTYDAEAMYLYVDSTHLYIGLSTGLSPLTVNDPRANSYASGDFALDFGQDGSFEMGIKVLGQQAGAVFEVAKWDYGIWDLAGNHSQANPDRRHPTSILEGELVGWGDLVYSEVPVKGRGAWKNDAHYFIEASAPLSLFSDYAGQKFDVHWTMNCANDAISADPEIPMPAVVDEPVSLGLLGVGALGLLLTRRRHAPRAKAELAVS